MLPFRVGFCYKHSRAYAPETSQPPTLMRDTLSPREQAFADYYIAGKTQGDAYTLAGYKATGASIDVGASKLIRKPAVVAYIRTERAALSEAMRMQKCEALDFLQSAIQTPIADLDENSPLVQEVTVDEVGELTVRTRIKMVPKLDALKQMAVMMGWNAPEKTEVGMTSELAELIRSTRRGD